MIRALIRRYRDFFTNAKRKFTALQLSRSNPLTTTLQMWDDFHAIWQGTHRVGLVAGRAECRRPARLKFAEPKFPSHQHSTSAHPQRLCKRHASPGAQLLRSQRSTRAVFWVLDSMTSKPCSLMFRLRSSAARLRARSDPLAERHLFSSRDRQAQQCQRAVSRA